MDAEHDVMAAAFAAAGTAIAKLKSSASGGDAAVAKGAVGRQEVTVSHFDHEEEELEPIFLANRDTPEIKEMGRKFGKVSPARGGRLFSWVLGGASEDEKAAVTRDVPGPVITIFGMGYRRNVAPVWKS